MNRINQGGEAAKRISQVEGKQEQRPRGKTVAQVGSEQQFSPRGRCKWHWRGVRAPGGLLSMGFGQRPQGNN